MNISWKLTVFILLTGTLPVMAQERVQLASPDHNIIFTFRLTGGLPEYSVSFRGKTIIAPSALSLSFQKNGSFGSDLKMYPPRFREGEDNYNLVVGKTSAVHDHYREVEIPLEERNGIRRKVNLLVRVFNDGLAFRYQFPKQANWLSYTLTDENSTFHLTGDPRVLAMFLPDFTTSHEGRYTSLSLSQVKDDELMDMPALFQFSDSVYLAITEAELVNYAGMYLIKHKGALKSQLSPWPGQKLIKVKATLPHQTPWRVMLISNRVGALIESNILTSLNEPCKIKDVSWIKPGKTDFHWWNGDIMPDTSFEPGINFQFNKYYIDFCAENGIAYHTVIGYGDVAWYKNDGVGYQPGPHTDVTKPRPGLDMREICNYAKQKGVGIRVWVHWKALYPQIDTAFKLFEQWGIKGMMVDFMNRDDQQMVNIQVEILQKAAAHHLHIQFHGAYKPTGLSRTYPNEFTREGTLNYENDKWGNPITPDDDINIPFTRLLAGSTDYHLGGFRAVTPSAYRAQYTRPLVLGTRCHMLAMYVVLENYIGMVCDYPDAYRGQPGFYFLKAVPTTWDETRVPTAKVGEWVSIARRKGADWYVGSINNSRAREIKIPLSFLPEGDFAAEIYSDAPDAGGNPDHLIRQMQIVRASDTLTVHLASGGGQAILLHRKLNK